MLLRIATTHRPATDLGFLVAKHPDKHQTFDLPKGRAHVFYPEANEERCEVALWLEIDPIGLVRGRKARDESGPLFAYVNDRPYVTSSFLSVALVRVFRTAMTGESRDRPELARQPLPLEAHLSVVPCRGGERFLRRLFEPLGYEVTAERLPLDETFPDWGEGSTYRVTLRATVKLADLLTHLYVLLPVLDHQKHYWVGRDELDKLLERGGDWLAAHPEREAIAQRFLVHSPSLAREAVQRLCSDDQVDPDETDAVNERDEETLERKLTLNEQRLDAVHQALLETGATSVLDLGCGEGRLLQALLKNRRFTRLVGIDVSHRSLEIAERRLNLERLPASLASRIALHQGSLTYRDARFEGFDALCLIEVIEHVDTSRLGALERVVFEFARPQHVIVTTPNVEYNVLFDQLGDHKLRHRDHRFEWTRAQFASWAESVAARHGYGVRFQPIGPPHEIHGAPTQMGVFSR